MATRMALIVWSRFSAWSNTMLAGDSNTSPVTSRPFGHAGVLHHLAPDGRVRVVERGQAVHELHPAVAGRVEQRPVHLVRLQELDPLVPDVLGLAHRDPDVGVDEVDAAHGLGRRRR